MKKILIASFALTAIAASPAFAATSKARTQVEQQQPIVTSQMRYSPYDRDTVTYGDKVIGRDPDLNIRSGILHDPNQNEY